MLEYDGCLKYRLDYRNSDIPPAGRSSACSPDTELSVEDGGAGALQSSEGSHTKITCADKAREY